MNKIMTLEEAIKAREGCKLVVTNGCFDILHKGHVMCLNNAKRNGYKLFVLLNSDESVRKLKGSERPINNEQDRAYMLANLECVDGVITYPDGECEPYKQIAEALVAADFTNWEIISDNG